MDNEQAQARLDQVEGELIDLIQRHGPTSKDLAKQSVELYAKLSRIKKAMDDGAIVDIDQFKRVAQKLMNEGFRVEGQPNV